MQGHQIEDPKIFFGSIGQSIHNCPGGPLLLVSPSVDWETFENSVAFVNSKEHDSLTAGLGQLFDFGVAAPLIRMNVVLLQICETCSA